MNENHAALYAALVKFQAECPPIVKTRTVATKSYSYSYADLSDILSTVKKALSLNGLFIIQRLDTVENNLHLTTLLGHSSGAHIESVLFVQPAQTLQALGANITYMRRYAISSMLGIAAEDDVDATEEAATFTTHTPKAPMSAPTPRIDPQPKAPILKISEVVGFARGVGYTNEQVKQLCIDIFQKDKSSDLTQEEIQSLLNYVKTVPPSEVFK